MRSLKLVLVIALVACAAGLQAGDAIALLNPQQEVNEGAGWVDFIVTRSGSGVGAVSVDVQAVPGSAALGVDYTAPQPGTVQWASGDVAAKIVRLPILHNPAFTYGSYLSLNLANPAGGAVLSSVDSISVPNLIIDDMEANPAGQLTMLVDSPAATLTVRDDAGPVAIRVQRSGGTLGAESCIIGFADMAALAGSDYVVPGSTSLSWNDGEGGVKTLLVTLIPRTQAQGVRSFYASISVSMGGADPDMGHGQTIAIIDHLPASAGTLGYPATLVVGESDGNAVLSVNRIGGTTGAVSVDYVTSDGNPYAFFFDSPAAAGTNYTTVSGTLNWAAGDPAPKIITIPLLPDGVARPLLDATITFSNPTGGLVVPIDPATFAATTILDILDDDGTAGLLGFSATQVTVDELAGQAVLTVTRSGGTTGAVSVDYVFGGGGSTAVAGVNYVGSGGTLHWLAGDSTPKQITIPILHDLVATSDRSFGVTLSNPSGGAGLDDGNAPRAWAGVTISDHDGGALDQIAFAATALSVHESSGPAVISVVRTGTGIGPAAIHLLIQAGTAQSGVDYTFPADSMVQWADGELGAHTLVIPLVYDGQPGPDRDFNVYMDVVSGNAAQPVTATQAIVTILDDDVAPAGTIAFTPAALSVRSDAGTVQLTLHRSGGSAGAISVDWNTVADATSDARPNADVVAAAGTASWAANDSSDQTIAITVLDDGTPGPSRTLVVHLGNAQGGAVLGTRDAVVTITDAGPFANGTISCLAATQTGDRVVGSAAILVGRAGGSTGAVTVAYRTAATTAVDGQDFLAAVGTLSWAAGDATDRTITVPLLNPAGALAGDLRIDLDQPTGGAVLGQATTLLSLSAAVAPATPAASSSNSHCGFGGGIVGLAALALAAVMQLGRRPRSWAKERGD